MNRLLFGYWTREYDDADPERLRELTVPLSTSWLLSTCAEAKGNARGLTRRRKLGGPASLQRCCKWVGCRLGQTPSAEIDVVGLPLWLGMVWRGDFPEMKGMITTGGGKQASVGTEGDRQNVLEMSADL